MTKSEILQYCISGGTDLTNGPVVLNIERTQFSDDELGIVLPFIENFITSNLLTYEEDVIVAVCSGIRFSFWKFELKKVVELATKILSIFKCHVQIELEALMVLYRRFKYDNSCNTNIDLKFALLDVINSYNNPRVVCKTYYGACVVNAMCTLALTNYYSKSDVLYSIKASSPYIHSICYRKLSTIAYKHKNAAIADLAKRAIE